MFVSQVDFLSCVELEQLYVEQCGVFALQQVLLSADEVVSALQYLHGVRS